MILMLTSAPEMAVPGLADALVEFEQAARVYSPRTRSTYLTGARRFVAFYADGCTSLELGRTCLEDFYTDLRNHGAEEAGARAYIAGALAFLRFLERPRRLGGSRHAA